VLRRRLCAGKPHTPDVIPTTSHLPLWNTMAMFVVQPGKSFHSVQVGAAGRRAGEAHSTRT
jgi:hypothetical protein